MAYEAFYAALRNDTARTSTTLPDADAEATFEAANAEWGDAGTQAGARVLLLRVDWASASNQADYTQNEESERLSQIAEAKKELLDYWEGKLADAIAVVEVPKGQRAAFFGLAKATRARWYP